MEKYIIFGVVAVIVILVGYFLFLVQQDRREIRRMEDSVASSSQLSSGTLAGAAVPQDEPVDQIFDFDNAEFETADDYDIPLGLLVDYMFGLLAPETQELVKRKFAEQNCYLNPLKKDAEGRVDLNLFIDTQKGREPIFTLEGFKPGEPSAAGRALDERVKAIRERRPYKRSADNSFDTVIGTLFDSELESFDAKVRAEEEAAKAGEKPVVQAEPEKKVEPAVEPAPAAGSSGFVAPPKPAEEFGAGAELGAGSQRVRPPAFVAPPQPGESASVAEEPGMEEASGVTDEEPEVGEEIVEGTDPEGVYHQPTEGASDDVDGSSGELKHDLSNVFEESADAGAEGDAEGDASEPVEEEKPAPEPEKSSVFAGIPEDVVEILKNPNYLAIPYCIYVSRRFKLGIEYDLSSVRSDLAIPSIEEVKAMCREWTLDSFFPMLRNMQMTGRYVEDALSGAGLPSVSRPKGSKIVISRQGKQ